jgi:hypothetical protein
MNLLDFCFLELNVLAYDRIVFLENELFGLGAGVLFRDVKIPRIRRGQELDLDHGGFGHRIRSGSFENKKNPLRGTARVDLAGNIRVRAGKSRR